MPVESDVEAVAEALPAGVFKLVLREMSQKLQGEKELFSCFLRGVEVGWG